MNQTFGEWFRELRENRQLSQDELAEASGITKSTISLYENDKIVQPRYKTLEKFARPLGVTKDEIRRVFAEKSVSKESADKVPPNIKALFQNSDKWSPVKHRRVFKHLELLVADEEETGEEFESQ